MASCSLKTLSMSESVFSELLQKPLNNSDTLEQVSPSLQNANTAFTAPSPSSFSQSVQCPSGGGSGGEQTVFSPTALHSDFSVSLLTHSRLAMFAHFIPVLSLSPSFFLRVARWLDTRAPIY